MIKADKEGRVLSAVIYGATPEHSMTDEFGRATYLKKGGKLVYSPQPYTSEQIEILRNEWIKAEIEKLYPNDIQLKINTENMDSILSGQGGTKAFAQMMHDRNEIKEKSKLIDFNKAENL